jgi:hypothetical protein
MKKLIFYIGLMFASAAASAVLQGKKGCGSRQGFLGAFLADAFKRK